MGKEKTLLEGDSIKRILDKSERKKKGLIDFIKMKEKHLPLTWITSYDFPFSYASEQAGIDMILVGDSGGMVQFGYETTNPVTMDEMIILSRSVKRGAPQTFIIGDMPQGSYEPSDRDAVINALRFIKEAGCDAVKCEGGKRITPRIRAMCDAGILVIGHLGLTPQSTASFGGYRVQCKTRESFEKTIEDAHALEEAGVFSILLEAMPQEPSGQIARQLDVPVYGIGAGNLVDGQLIIMHDLLGLYQPFRPYFAKCYIPGAIQKFSDSMQKIDNLKEFGQKERKDGFLALAEIAISQYIEDVHSKKFPSPDYIYPINDNDLNELKKSKYWK